MAQCCSLGVISNQTRLNGGHLGSSGFRYGSSGLIRTHGDSDLAHLGRRLIGGRRGSSGLRSGSLGSSGVMVIEIQIWLNGGHLDCDLIHWGLLGLMGTKIWLNRTLIWFIGGRQGSLGLRFGPSGLNGAHHNSYKIDTPLSFECI